MSKEKPGDDPRQRTDEKNTKQTDEPWKGPVEERTRSPNNLEGVVQSCKAQMAVRMERRTHFSTNRGSAFLHRLVQRAFATAQLGHVTIFGIIL